MSATVTSAPSVSERLAEHVVGTRFADLPASVVRRTKDLLGYHLALAFARRSTDAGRSAIALAYELSGGSGSSTVIGQRRPATLLDAIYAHSELIGSVATDINLRSKVPAARVAHPAAWVLGEREQSSGEELITALVVGYDAACKLGEPQPTEGNYTRVAHKCAFTPFAAAAVAARLLRQDPARASHTIAHAARFYLGEAFAISLIARNGVMAAFLPKFVDPKELRSIEGPKGMYAQLFDGPPPGLEASLATLGREFAIFGVTVARYPMSNSHLAPLEQTQGLRERAGLRAEDVVSLVATLPDRWRGRFEYQEAAIDGPNPIHAETIRSLRLKLAILLVDGTLVPQPDQAQFHRPEVRATLPKIRLAFEARPVDTARIEVATADGRTVRAEGPYTPYVADDWSASLHMHGERFLTKGRLAQLEALLERLEDVKDVGEILRCTVPDRDGEV